jgi:hypothetical protein
MTVAVRGGAEGAPAAGGADERAQKKHCVPRIFPDAAHEIDEVAPIRLDLEPARDGNLATGRKRAFDQAKSGAASDLRAGYPPSPEGGHPMSRWTGFPAPGPIGQH